MSQDQTKSNAKPTKSAKMASLTFFLLITGLVLVAVLLYNAFSSKPDKSGSSKAPAATSQNNSNSPVIYISPRSGTYSSGSTILVEVRENSGSTPVNAVQANFDYPTDKLNLQSIDASNSPFTAQAQNGGGDGQVILARGIVGSLTGDQLVAKVSFSVNSTPGVASLAFANGTALVTSTGNTNLITSLSMTGSAIYSIK